MDPKTLDLQHEVVLGLHDFTVVMLGWQAYLEADLLPHRHVQGGGPHMAITPFHAGGAPQIPFAHWTEVPHSFEAFPKLQLQVQGQSNMVPMNRARHAWARMAPCSPVQMDSLMAMLLTSVY